VAANTGPEGEGKSTLSLYMGSILDEHFQASQIADSQKQFEKITDTLDKGQAIIVDEGVHWLFNRNWNTPEAKIAVGDLMVIRELNLAIIINIYSLRYLDIYLRSGRLKFATKVYTKPKMVFDGDRRYLTRARGFFSFYTRKTILNYFDPSKNYQMKPAFDERFPKIQDLEGGEKLWEEYRKRKREIIKNRPKISDFEDKRLEKQFERSARIDKWKLKKMAEESKWAEPTEGIENGPLPMV